MGQKQDTGRWPDERRGALGDFWPHCPAEWSKKSALHTARHMMQEHGVVVAIKRAKRWAMCHPPGSWGRKHWDIVVAWLRTQLESAE